MEVGFFAFSLRFNVNADLTCVCGSVDEMLAVTCHVLPCTGDSTWTKLALWVFTYVLDPISFCLLC